MKRFGLIAGGLVAGLVIVAGEAMLNLVVLADDWATLFVRFDLAQPTPAGAAQGLLKLLALGIFCVWLADRLDDSRSRPQAPILAGLIVWFLVWAWVQWGMLLVGYVTARVAIWTVAWGLVELPLATWLGFRVGKALAPPDRSMDVTAPRAPGR